MYHKKRIRYITVKEMNILLRYAKDNYYVIHYDEEPVQPLMDHAFIQEGRVKFTLTMKRGDMAGTYITYKDNREAVQQTDGGEAFRIMNEYYRVPRINKELFPDWYDPDYETKLLPSARPLLWKNDKYDSTRTEGCYGYDLNKAYAYALLQPMPDTSVAPGMGYIKKGEQIGFDLVELPGGGMDVIIQEEGWTDYLYNLMPSPFYQFVMRWVKRGKNAKTATDKAIAKGTINFAVGMLQRHNIFLRAAVVQRANKIIRGLIDENTLYCNTDSIVSMVKRPDIEAALGDDIGQWKIEHRGSFAFKGFNYQWNFDIPSIRSIPKKWFKPGWDILNDPLPGIRSEYAFDKKNLKLIEVTYNET